MIKQFYRQTWLQRPGLFLLVMAVLSACGKQDPGNPMLQVTQPANFPSMHYNLAANPVTANGFALGRQLFYDEILSANNTISCGNCHQQAGAFSHIDHAVSHGINDLLGTRNAPALQNLAFYNSFMWDGGVFDLDLQPIAPIESHVEMGEQMGNVLAKLNRSNSYRQRFKQAFEVDSIRSVELLRALSQFMVMLVSGDATYDHWKRQEPGGTFTPDELAGERLFRQKCSSCHAGDLFTDQSFRNNGLPPNSINDEGRFLVTLQPMDAYRFKVPSLRNVAVTAPYMHDGRFRTLQAVLDHYSSGVQPSATLDNALQQNGSVGIALSATEKQQLIQFLNTLTDEKFLHDTRFAEQ